MPRSTSESSRWVRTLRAIPSRCWKSSKRDTPKKASLTMSMLHHSPTASRHCATEQVMSSKLFLCTNSSLPGCVRQLTSGTVGFMTGLASPATARPQTRPGIVLAILCSGVILGSLDLFIVNVALPQIAHDFGDASLGSLSWVLNAYAIVFAALLVPTSLGLVLAAYPAERRGGAVRIWTAMGGLAAGLGPVLGGLLVAADWRWAFSVNVPGGLAARVLGWRLLPDVPGDRGPIPDAAGALLLTFSIGALVLGLVKSNDWGWGSGRVVALLAASVAATALFVLRSGRHRSPVLELSLLRVPSYSVTLLATMLFSAAFAGMLLSIVLWAQNDWGWSALKTGLAVSPGPLMVPVLSVASGRLIPRFGPGPVIAAGCAAFAAGLLWWTGAVGLQPHYADVLGG